MARFTQYTKDAEKYTCISRGKVRNLCFSCSFVQFFLCCVKYTRNWCIFYNPSHLHCKITHVKCSYCLKQRVNIRTMCPMVHLPHRKQLDTEFLGALLPPQNEFAANVKICSMLVFPKFRLYVNDVFKTPSTCIVLYFGIDLWS